STWQDRGEVAATIWPARVQPPAPGVEVKWPLLRGATSAAPTPVATRRPEARRGHPRHPPEANPP
ncbi:MAG: hypothetical protein ABJB78_09675, partial [Betaproteobacteria bacterium]